MIWDGELYGNIIFLDIAAEKVAEIMQVSVHSVYRYTERFQLTGEVRKSLQWNGPLPLLSECEEFFLMHLSLTRPGIYLRELQHELLQHTGRLIDTSTICRAVKRLGMTCQRIRHLVLQRSEVKRAEFAAEMHILDPSMIIWIDEMGSDRRNALRKYGYGFRGLPPQDYSLQLRSKRHSAIGIMSTEGVEDVFITDESVDGEVFLFFVRNHLLPILQPFDGYNAKSVVVMDNASIHHVDSVVACINSVGALVHFLPPYSLDFNPIESVFGEVKQYLQANNLLLHTSLSMNTILLMAFNSVSQLG